MARPFLILVSDALQADQTFHLTTQDRMKCNS